MDKLQQVLDVIDRAYEGPPCEERDFDMQYVAAGTAKAIKKYDLRFEEPGIIQQNDEKIDRLWEAAVDFLESCGVYNTTTGRRITFTRKEIEESIQNVSPEIVLGEGEDAHTVRHRVLEDERPPTVIGGPIGTPLSEDMYIPIMESYVREKMIDTTTPGTLATTYGRIPRTNSPLETAAARQEVDLMFEVLANAGRPGMSIGGVQMGMSGAGYLSAISRGGYRPCDWQSIAMYNEMKTNNELLGRAIHSVSTNGIIHGFYNPVFGGFAGGTEGLAVVLTAGAMATHLLYNADQHGTAPITPAIPADTLPQVLRPLSAALAAISRHSNLLVHVMTSPVSGPGTESLLHECVAVATLATACGASGVFGVRSAAGVVENHCGGLEARFNGEVGHAAAGLNREDANRIVTEAVETYKSIFPNPPLGKPFSATYDVASREPTKEWLAIYERAKEQAESWGLPIS